MRRIVFTTVLVWIVTGAAHAQWPANGKYLMGAPNGHNHSRYVQMFDLPGGEFYVVAVGRGGTSNGHGLQRLRPNGEIEPGWPVTGVSLGSFQVAISPTLSGFTIDDSLCFWHSSTVTSPSGVGAHFVRPNAAPSPSTSLWRVTNTSLQWSDAAPGTAGDIYVVSAGTNLKRIDRGGALKAGWPASGVNFSNPNGSPTDAALLPDGSGGVVWFQSIQPIVKRYDASGLLHAGWPATGLTLTNDLTDGNTFDGALFRPLVRSGASHCFAAWTMPYTSSPVGIRLQRFSLDGALASGWPASGLEIATAGVNVTESVTLIEDGSDGVYVLWYKDGVPVGTHVLADGSVLGSAQAPLLPAGASFTRPTHFLAAPIPYLMADRTPDGGLVFAWDELDGSDVPRIRVRWLQPDLTPDQDEPSDGWLIVKATQGPSGINYTLRTVHSDGVGGAYVAWEVMRAATPPETIGEAEIWMTRILPSALLDTPRPAPVSARLALSAPRPNPTRGLVVSAELSLADDGPAFVELLDVSGRVLAARHVEGAGPHEISFAETASVPVGLYFIRARGLRAAQVRRIVVTR